MIPDQNITALIERLASLDTIITRIDAKRQSFILLLDDQGENNLSKPSSLNEWGLPKMSESIMIAQRCQFTV